jgi:hypothetical protein
MGAVPVICSWKEGEAVTEMDDTTDWTSTEVFVLLTKKQSMLEFEVYGIAASAILTDVDCIHFSFNQDS